MKTTLPVVLVMISVAMGANAEITSESGRGNTQSQDRIMSLKKSIENKISDTSSRGSESTDSHSKKNNGSKGGNYGLDLQIPARALIPEDIEYQLPVDFGLTARERDGWINMTEQQFYDQAAKSEVMISSFANEAALRRYLIDVATFGARAGQTQIYLNEWIGKIGRLKKNRAGDYEVIGLGADDLISLAAGAWIKSEHITDKRIKRDLDAIKRDRTPCRLGGNTQTIQCGAIVLSLTAPPALRFRQVEWFGGSFAGIGGNYKVSSSWSWQKTLEDSRGTSSFARKTSDELEAKGDAFDATMTRKQAVEKTNTNKSTMSSGKPGQ